MQNKAQLLLTNNELIRPKEIKVLIKRKNERRLFL